ncbi:MAG: IS1182 family transposase [Ignavibacteria bacterium]|nr:IS1182 family transposase [Ignavibacteria bacterium]
MLGKRSPQGSLFACDQRFRDLVGAESFYVYLAERRHELFRDEDFASLYCLDNGRPSIAPSVLAVALLLQWYDSVSDEEAARRAKLDLSWKVALGIELMDVPFVKSVLCEFRNKLILHKQQKHFFDLSLKHARTQGFFKSRNIQIALDTTPMFGRGAVEDTYNMLAEALRLLINALCAFAHESAEEFATGHDLSRYVVAKSFKGSFASINWDNPDERQSVLDCLVADCERTLVLAREALTDLTQESPESMEIVKASTLLRRLLAQDVERTNSGAAKITQGVAQDRIVSVHDTEMRHGRKSVSQCFNGYKGALAVEPSSQIITAVDVIPANVHDSQDAQALIDESAEKTGLSVTTVIGDGAYGTIEARLDAQEAEIPYTLVAPVARLPHTGRFTKEDFHIDIEHSEVRCPAGEVTQTYSRRTEKKRTGRTFAYQSYRFTPKQCGTCALRTQCLKQTTPYRSVLVHEHEGLVTDAKAFQRTDIFRTIYRTRVAVEHRIARLMRFGARKARYFGSSKVLFQFAMAAALANLTLMASQTQNGLFIFFVLTLILALLLGSRSRMSYGTLSSVGSSRTRLHSPVFIKTGGCQLAF